MDVVKEVVTVHKAELLKIPNIVVNADKMAVF